ncbi:two-component sensor histidine kinase [Marinibactrum halimedae]|uniref:histidine kinase n=1 Tax=Marinibactrum halimedae TaxID=1444977 RepID=A0AA37T4F5_9GAMM|nr:two-component sensor histidine kinase [Marinibactrum halimedae]
MGIPNSLNGRLLLASVCLLPVFVAVSGTALDRAFVESQESAAEERLRTHIYLLLGAAEVFGSDLWLPDELQEPRFNQPSSGLYAQISDRNHRVQWQSNSAVSEELPAPLDIRLVAGREIFTEVDVAGKPAHSLSFDVSWDSETGEERTYRFQVINDQSALLAERKSYRGQLWRWLSTLTIILIVLQWLIQRWGLNPLGKLATDLKSMEQGKSLKLNDDYPDEIQPVTKNLNRVLEVERAQRDRYRNTLADLAHSLKTPLAVMRGNLESQQEHRIDSDNTDFQIMDDQLQRMDEIIRHQLQRAVAQHAGGLPGKGIPLLKVTERIANALTKVYQHKSVAIHLNIDDTLEFNGDEGDLMELLGNIMENACKYGDGKVNVSASRDELLTILVEDNGPGVPLDRRKTVLTRGARADTATTGQGIGLAVAVDILSSYNGGLTINKSEHLGGAEFKIEVP